MLSGVADIGGWLKCRGFDFRSTSAANPRHFSSPFLSGSSSLGVLNPRQMVSHSWPPLSKNGLLRLLRVDCVEWRLESREVVQGHISGDPHVLKFLDTRQIHVDLLKAGFL